MVNWKSRALGDYLAFANGLALVVLLNVLASHYFFRLDLTEEKRYSIKPQTRALLRELQDEVYIEVYLEGDLNAGFRRFQKAVRETLEEFRIHSRNNIRYAFVDPAQAGNKQAQSEFMADLARRGIQPTNVIDTRDGQRVEKLIFPGAVLSVGGYETAIMLLKGSTARTSDERINQSIENLEYEFIHAIQKFSDAAAPRVGFVEGHGELDSIATTSLRADLQEHYQVNTVRLPATRNCDVLVIAKPQQPLSPVEKYALDQYIMHGGRVVFLIDQLDASMDSIAKEDQLAVPYTLGLDDQLFKYGVRLNPDLVQDRVAAPYPIVVGQSGGQPQAQLIDWPFFPLVNHYADHPITRNLDAVLTRFVGSIDTVKASGVRKTPLMFSSDYARALTAPVPVSVNALRRDVKPEDFNRGAIPVAYLLEGTFTSLYKNRFLPDGADTTGFRDTSVPTRLLVVADGDLAQNDINRRTGQAQPLGFYRFNNYTYANRDLLMNAIAYLADENGLIQARAKQVKIRPLNRERIKTEKLKWQVLNLGLPLVLLAVFGMVHRYSRRKKFARF